MLWFNYDFLKRNISRFICRNFWHWFNLRFIFSFTRFLGFFFTTFFLLFESLKFLLSSMFFFSLFLHGPIVFSLCNVSYFGDGIIPINELFFFLFDLFSITCNNIVFEIICIFSMENQGYLFCAFSLYMSYLRYHIKFFLYTCIELEFYLMSTIISYIESDSFF